jgi:hypothetical protein
MKYLENIIDYYNDLIKNNATQENYIELELKLLLDTRNTPNFIKKKSIDKSINISKDLFIQLLNHSAVKQSKIKQTINFISSSKENNKVSIIKELHFNEGIQDKEGKKIYKKERFIDPLYFCSLFDYKLSLSNEIKTEEELTYDLIRAKLRFTFIIDNWNIDFTFVKESQSQDINEIKNIKSKLFCNNINTKNIIDEHNWLWEYSKIEIEFEHHNHKLDIMHIKQIFDLTNDIINLNSFNLSINPEALDKVKFFTKLDKLFNNKIYKKTLKNILPNAIELNKKEYFKTILPSIEDYYLTDKADGLRTLLIIDNCIMYTFDNEFTNLNQRIEIGDTILECELVDNIFYAFDILQFNGKSVLNNTFDERLILLNGLTNKHINLKIKEFIKLDKTNYQTEIIEYFEKSSNKDYCIDGLIFTLCNSKYLETKYYKWKPVKNMSIDFLVKECPKELMGIYPYLTIPGKKLYLLFCGISFQMFKKLNIKKVKNYNRLFYNQYNYFPIQFSPSDNPNAYLYWHSEAPLEKNIDNKIIELTYNKKDEAWNFIKVRDDRNSDLINNNYYGNDYRVAELIWRNFSNPLTLKHLCLPIEEISNDFYFVAESNNHVALRKFNNNIKYEIYEKLTNNFTKDNYVIDFGCGKGQDMFKFINLDIKNMLLIDNNENNLCEIIDRKYDFTKNNLNKSSNIRIINLDLCNEYKFNLDKIKQFFINKKDIKLIVCNFAIHYFIKDEAQIGNLANLIYSLLSSGGRFVFTCMDGEKVFNLLKENNNEYGDRTKYFIRGCYSDDKKITSGQEIEVLLPFSNGKLYKEYLTDLTLIEKIFKRKKLFLESESNFVNYLDNFKINHQNYYNKLDELDLNYIKLLNFSIYYKK